MAERTRLAREHVALRVHNMRLKFGDVVREGRTLFSQHTGTCIDCGWTIREHDVICRARWERRSTAGFYAHEICSPIRDSEWLNDETEFTDVFSRGKLLGLQCCLKHGNQVELQVLNGDYLRYACPRCV
jgi:hypothetical protein